MKKIKNLYRHGGNIYEVKCRNTTGVLDFSANINPLGIPQEVRELLCGRIESLLHYPDPEARSLKTAIARYWSVKEENVLIGNGSTELIYLITAALAPCRVTIPVPSFTEYERAARIAKSKVKFIRLSQNNGFLLNPSHIKDCDMLFICNPNNPTANLIMPNPSDIEKLRAKRIIIDEAFMDFMPNEKKYTFILRAIRSKKIIVMRTLTKFFALAGLRLGYIIAHPDIICILRKYQMPWSVNVLAQAAGECALTQDVFMRRSRQVIKEERFFLSERISRITGFKAFPSVTNFVLIKIENRQVSSSFLRERLLKKGILIRDCANFRGLNGQFIRAAVRLRKENLRLIQALEDCV